MRKLMLASAALVSMPLLAAAIASPSSPETDALLNGCGDIPEAVALADTLRLRKQAVDRALADLDRQKAEIETARANLRDTLDGLRRAQAVTETRATARKTGKSESIARLIAVYDSMKPAEAARVLSAMPPDFAAEILARVTPDNSARIIAAIEPTQAAILTARMGTRRITQE